MLANNEQEQGPVECRICHSRTTRDLILSPCLCKGSLACVHFNCLQRWLNHSSRDSCELCSYKFNCVLNRRYSCLQSVPVWLNNPSTRAYILCDVVIGIVLTSLTLLLMLVCFVGLSRFIQEGYNQGIKGFWSEGVVDLFLIALLAGYIATMYSMAKDHVRPWYLWWTRCNDVSLVLDKNTIVSLPTQGSSEDLIVVDDKSVKNKIDESCKENKLTVEVKEVEICSVFHNYSSKKKDKRKGCESLITDKKSDNQIYERNKPSVSEEIVKTHTFIKGLL